MGGQDAERRACGRGTNGGTAGAPPKYPRQKTVKGLHAPQQARGQSLCALRAGSVKFSTTCFPEK